ncbi:uncharacterized protein LOC128863429 isoform X2 [Anastrepha ludens]|uniref:uncharacterized protein LOC128863429 isoform X2 n=1 Tax=Anastrepha ludens TaxID=28586 RepID=UPI0023B0D926|nr:uncharacterized protein LOC128863429 isoform X2 [Anastrepha ludens]
MPAKCSDQVARAMQLEMELSAIIPALCENNCPICPRLSNIAKLISKYCSCWSLPKHKAQGARHLQCNQSSNIP